MSIGISKTTLRLAVISILATGFIHTIEAPDAFHEASYKGWLFCLNKKTWGWNLGFLIAALSIILYVISRTAGLPNIPAEPDEWFEPLGVAALLAEGIFIVMFARASRPARYK